ncbi:MAG TPA: hypothetical protein VFY29_08230 [Terriglobia bacterium]|nr:hypothetical protein [Terriglobia bacterium]
MTESTSSAFIRGRIARLAAVVGVSALLAATPAYSQNFTTDARRIGMGAIGGNESEASKLAGDSRQYRSIGIPLGLIQVVKNTKIFNPSEDDFNPIRAMEYIANPMHITFNRDSGGAGDRLVTDLINSGFSTDLSVYKGFTPSPNIDAAGLLSPSWGMTFKVARHGDGYQGIYVGAGPYASVGTNLDIDQTLINYLGDPNAPAPANTTFMIGDVTGIQGAVAITGGYRARLPLSLAHLSSGNNGRNGVYVAANFNYLHGLRYENADLDVMIQTDSTGHLTLMPSSNPIVVDHLWAESGKGYSVDVSTDIVVDRWNAGFAVEGIGNRIDWNDLSREQWALTSLTTGVDFVKTPLAAPTGSLKVTLPVRYAANAGVNVGGGLFAAAEYRHGLQNNEFHGGAEYPFMFLEFRGGLRYSRPKWNPTVGLGLNLGKRVGIDVAGFGTTTNVEHDRKAAIALSLRINAKEQSQ